MIPSSRLQVPAELAGLRADALLAVKFPFLSRTRIKQKIQMGESLLNGRRYASSARLKEGDEITLEWRSDPERQPAAGRTLAILFEDPYFLAVDKQAGMAVHPSGKIQSGTVIQLARERYRLEIEAGLLKGDRGTYPSLVNRLDMFTSGVVLVARRSDVLVEMQKLAAKGEIEKRYTALVEGLLEADRGRISLPLGPDTESAVRIKMTVKPDGRPCVTEYEVLCRYAGFTLLHAFPLNGRQHQIRAHFAAMGHPVQGDLIYKDERLFLRYWENSCSLDASFPRRHLLHAERVSFTHPVTGRRIEISSPIPEDFQEVVEALTGCPPSAS
jgi:23S rRNA pseudouridine1911/1915/1917 synthase